MDTDKSTILIPHTSAINRGRTKSVTLTTFRQNQEGARFTFGARNTIQSRKNNAEITQAPQAVLWRDLQCDSLETIFCCIVCSAKSVFATLFHILSHSFPLWHESCSRCH